MFCAGNAEDISGNFIREIFSGNSPEVGEGSADVLGDVSIRQDIS